jgi:adenylate cyclase
MRNKNRLTAILITLLAGLTCGLLPQFRFWQDFEAKGYDLLTIATAPEKSVLPITVIGVDEASFAHIGQRWPWSRALHARVIDQLAASGAAVVVFDIVFSEPSALAAEDADFARAIKSAGNVVLAADYVYQETEAARQWLRVDPHPSFIVAGATGGLAGAAIDGDTILRRFPTYPDAMWVAAIKTLQRMRPGIVEDAAVGGDARIRHLGPPHTFPYVSYYKVLEGDFPPGYFQDQIVLIGRDLRANPEVGMAQADLFATPFLMRDKQLIPGVEMHATLIENALTGQVIYPVSTFQAVLALVLAVGMALPAIVKFHPLGSGLWIAAVLVAVAGVGWWLFDAMQRWLPLIHIMLALVLAYISVGLWSYLLERRRAVQIKSAFSKYVARDVVEQMIAQPDRLKLGGERRELTLLFTDLAGFTSISEKLRPDTVASLINLYLTEMTEVIMGTRGTVDKFIGDSVMAFWGAPLADEDHALHAVTAAAAMQAAMVKLQPKFQELGVAEVHQRIGLHTGEAIVGNMGSTERFDYTALGDTVNLASRLEGANKPYGTGILLSETTAQAVKGKMRLRQVDRVRVKGKQQPIDIYTPSEDLTLNQLTDQALTAYQRGEWQKARTAWQEVATYKNDDPLPPVFLARIDALEQNPPADWEGVVSLEK